MRVLEKVVSELTEPLESFFSLLFDAVKDLREDMVNLFHTFPGFSFCLGFAEIVGLSLRLGNNSDLKLRRSSAVGLNEFCRLVCGFIAA